MKSELQLLCISAALAAGEGLGAAFPSFCASYPVVALTLFFVILLGHGFACRHWPLAAVFLLGLLLFQLSAKDREASFRDRPWLRTAHHLAKESSRSTSGCAGRMRRDLSRRVGLGLEHSREMATLNRAILLGERSRMPRKTRNLFIDAGTIHIFAISGLHVMIVAKTLVVGLGSLFCPLRFAGLLALPVLWLYVMIIGCPPSAVRACTMATIYYLAPLFWRKPSLMRAWSLTFLIVHVANPSGIADVGSLLSFTVMLAIAMVCSLPGLPRSGLGGTLTVSAAAWLAGMPIAAHVFGRITPGGMLANLALIPAAEISVRAGVIGALASFISERLARHLNNLCALFTGLMVEISRAIASLPGANLSIPCWSIGQCLAYYLAIVLCCWLYLRLRGRKCL